MISGILHGLIEYSLPGVFLVSFIGNVIPYSAIPYLAFVAAYSVASSVSKLEISILGGLGASLGKIILYLIAKYAGKKLSEKRKEDLISFQQLFQRRGMDFILIYLFAALPLPDDVLYFPLGFAGYNIVKFVLSVTTGKIMLVGLTALWGEQVGWLIKTGMNILPLPIIIAILVLITLYTLMMIFYTDWKGIVETLAKEGGTAALKHFLKELVLILVFKHEKIRRKTRKMNASASR